MVDLEVVGRHALLFDDDGMAAFVNSGDALVDWHSLQIDRYDVRHLLSVPPPPRRRRIPQPLSSSDAALEFELDLERYLDLPPPSDEPEAEEGEKTLESGGFHAVGFSYGNTNGPDNQKEDDAETGFRPSFPVPDNLLQSLPPTEKVHQIIARTSTFVSKHGGQSEIVLRVKQGDNPTFGFLMPDHHLHPYFRFLVEHQELLQSGADGKDHLEEGKPNNENRSVGALSLLGTVYGSGDDEDGMSENHQESKVDVSQKEIHAVDVSVSGGIEKTGSSTEVAQFDEKNSSYIPSVKGKSLVKRNPVITSKTGSSTSSKKGNDSSSSSVATRKSNVSGPEMMSNGEPLIMEPPSEIKRLIDKIVEFIMKNGKQFEATLIEQDNQHGRFPFLLPSNQYHSYYAKVLQEAHESKASGKGSISGKNTSSGLILDRKASLSGENNLFSGCTVSDIPYDADRKEKFKMVIGKLRKDLQESPPSTTHQEFGVRVDAAAAAAILQAASRGIKNPDLGIIPRTSLTGSGSEQNGEDSGSLPAAKAISKTSSRDAVSEADSSDAHMSREQKLKAERLRRAKMFMAMVKSGAAPSKSEAVRSLSAEPEFVGSGTEISHSVKKRESSLGPLDDKVLDKNKNLERNYFDDECNERRSRRKYRSRSERHEDNEDDEDSVERDRKDSRKKHKSDVSLQEGDDRSGENEDHKYSRKKRRSRRFSREEDDEYVEKDDDHKRSKRKQLSYSYSLDDGDEETKYHKHSRKKHSSHLSSRDVDDEDEDDERGRKHHRKRHHSRHSSRHGQDGHKHRKRHSSRDIEHSRHRHKHDSSTKEERRRHSKSHDKHGKGSHAEEEELEEGEISTKTSDQSKGAVGSHVSREASLEVSSSRAPSQPTETTEVSDDLRAKIRAMLMATR